MVLDALAAGRLKMLDAGELGPKQADMGMMRSAAWTLCGGVKKVAVKIVSYVPVN